MMFRHAALLGLALISACGTSAAQSSRPGADEPVASTRAGNAGGFRRDVNLLELGFADGVAFSGLSGQRDLFFPVPRTGLQSLSLHLDLRGESAFGSRRSVQVSVADRIMASRALHGTETTTAIDLPIDPSVITGDFLKVSIAYSGAITEDRCVDQRIAGDFLNVLPTSSLRMQLRPDAVGTVATLAALMPRDVTVLVPDRRLTEAEAQALLRVSAVFGADQGLVRHATLDEAEVDVGTPTGLWSRGLVLIGNQADHPDLPAGGEGGALSVLRLDSGPALVVAGGNPSAASRMLASRWRRVAGGSAISVSAATDPVPPGEALSFGDLGLDIKSASLVDRAVFDASFSAADLPAGMEPTALSVDLALGSDIAGTDASIAAFLNDRLLASTTAPADVPARLSASIPAGLVGRDNAIRILVQRQPQTGDCSNPPQGAPVQLLPSSSISLGKVDHAPRDFFELAPAFAGGVTIFLPGDGSGAAMWPGLASLAASLVPDTAPISVRYGAPDAAPSTAFIAVSETAPPGGAVPLRLDQGRVVLADADDRPLFDIGGLERHALAQVVTGLDVPGLWLRPGVANLGSGRVPLRLDRGNVALIDEDGVALAFSTERDSVVEVRYPDRTSWLETARRYRPWLIGAAWLVLTVAFVTALSRIYRRRRAG